MVGSPASSQNHTQKPIKFLCSYGGRILPRYPDGKLRYHGGDTRVLSVDRSISFSDFFSTELLVKLREMCGTSVNLRCQLPAEDLDALVSITSDEDLANLIEEYDRADAAAATAAPPFSLKIRAFLSAPKTTKKSSSPPSSASSSSNGSSSPKSPFYPGGAAAAPPRCPTSANGRCHHHHGHGNGGPVYVIHNGNHWQ
ncbi:hypothetical protein PHJA_001894300 [Phtheirospermum japonicum]|uniref:PB1 domain-containing protein n=1 Tax=Phtheirospermum japonicum TaxID=374723 RepID=A0A830CGV4_9LAMI|nr:hypothetical protein PHJA_001894300 [Phtheirospermum japonicum]